MLATFLYASRREEGTARSAAAVATALEIYSLAAEATDKLRAKEDEDESSRNLDPTTLGN